MIKITVETVNEYDVVIDDRDGLMIKSNLTGSTYEILEGLSFKSKGIRTTSDILFIIEYTKDYSDTNFIDFVYGASDFDSDDFILDYIMNAIKEYEQKTYFN